MRNDASSELNPPCRVSKSIYTDYIHCALAVGPDSNGESALELMMVVLGLVEMLNFSGEGIFFSGEYTVGLRFSRLSSAISLSIGACAENAGVGNAGVGGSDLSARARSEDRSVTSGLRWRIVFLGPPN